VFSSVYDTKTNILLHIFRGSNTAWTIAMQLWKGPDRWTLAGSTPMSDRLFAVETSSGERKSTNNIITKKANVSKNTKCRTTMSLYSLVCIVYEFIQT